MGAFLARCKCRSSARGRQSAGHAAMREEDGFALLMGSEMIGVVDVDGCGEDGDRRRGIFEFLVQGLSPRGGHIR